MHDNRRYEYRILADIVVDKMVVDAHKPLTAKAAICELSASGCRLETNMDLEVGQKLKLSFHLQQRVKIKNLQAQVIRRLSQRSRRVVALGFLGLLEEDQYKIREWIIWREATAHLQGDRA
jgi:hypothetical protein